MITISIAVASFVIGLLAPLWFGRWLPPVRKLRKGAQWIDPLLLNTPASPVSVQRLREHEKCGDQIVIAHHLADWTLDLERKIFHSLVANSCFLFVLVVVFTVKGDEHLQRPDATWHDLLVAVETHWPFSILLAASVIEIVVFVRLVSDQAAKHAKVIKAARPPPQPIRERLRGLSVWR